MTQIPKSNRIWNSQAHQRVVLNNSDGPKLAVKTTEIIHEVLRCRIIKKYFILWKMFWKILGIVGRSKVDKYLVSRRDICTACWSPTNYRNRSSLPLIFS